MNIRRYQRSRALWLLLIIAPIAARLMISDEGGRGVAISVGGHLPILTSSVMGVWLGIVVSTIVLPLAYIFLRANTTRLHPWQVEEVTAASRLAIMFGRFVADSSALLATLTALTVAGCFLGWLMVSGPWNPFAIALPLWVVAAPSLLMVAAIRTFFDSVPLFRRAVGDTCFFIVWIVAMSVAAAVIDLPSTYVTNLYDMTGSVRPLVEGAPDGTRGFAIGGMNVNPGRIDLDVSRGLAAPGYLAARATWTGIALFFAMLAGALYRPHRASATIRGRKWLDRFRMRRAPPTPDASVGRAPSAAIPLWSVLIAEIRLICSGPLFPALAVVAAAVGLFGDYRQVGSPVALLLLVFALSAHAGRTEARNLKTLTATMAVSPTLRRATFIFAGTCVTMLLAVPAALIHVSAAPVMLAVGTGVVVSVIAITCAWATGSPVFARIALIILWYGYFST